MDDRVPAALLLREVVRIFSRSQRIHASCVAGASSVQCHVLNELLRNPGITQQHLVEKLGLDKSWISRAIDGLVKTGAVTKQTDQTDRRCVNLSLTSSGLGLAQQLDHQLNEHAAQVLNSLSNEQNQQIAASLQLLLDNLNPNPPTNTCKSRGSP